MTASSIIRQLTLDDADAFFYLRLKALQESPTSFLGSYEEEKQSGKASIENLLRQNKINNVVFGAFMGDSLIGVVGLFQAQTIKA